MTQKTRRFSGVLFGMATAAALGFGATQAVAASQPYRPCPPWNPPISFGSCGSQGGCASICKKYTGTSAGANCTGGCCYCN